jgi:lipopolysaccharide biosynthesis glycosyltransferase
MTLNEDENDIDPTPLKIFIGWDSKEDIAYQVCKHSILNHASVPVDIIPLKLKQLRRDGIYTRPADNLASTEFTFTRFLIPELCEFNGWALFIDCDFIFLEDIKNLFDQVNDKYAVMCAHHDYTPKPGIKMDGQQQHIYPRKNWSSCVLFNCSHPSNKICTSDWLNNVTKNGAFFHRFSWLKNKEIGKISHEWNWLVGWYEEPVNGKPKALHYTEGGPWFDNYYNCEYAVEWYKIERKLKVDQEEKRREEKRQQKNNIRENNPVLPEQLSIPTEDKEIFNSYLNCSIDPSGKYLGTSEEDFMQIVQNKFNKGTTKIKKVAAIFNDEIEYTDKSYMYDEYLQAMSIGVQGRLSTWDEEKDTSNPILIRGVGKSSQIAVKHCWKTGRDFYAIDTGYFGNSKSKSKGWHRVTKNALQNTGPIIELPTDRLKTVGYNYKKFKDGRKILICPPSEKVMNLFDQPDPKTWTDSVIKELKQYTDRPIEVRLKPDRTQRISSQSIEAALADNVYCLITYNSIAALESLIEGVPSIALGPNCASVVCNTSLKQIEKLNRPDKDTMIALMAHLSYCQFTLKEMTSGYAWNMVNESY